MRTIVSILLFCTVLVAPAQEGNKTGIRKNTKSYLDSLWYNGEHGIAIQYVEELIKTDSLNPELYCTLGYLKEAENSSDKSIVSDFKMAISLDSSYADGHWLCGKHYMGMVYGQDYAYKMSYLENDSSIYFSNNYYLDSAIYYYEKLLEIDSTWFYSIRTSLYDLYLSKGEISKATTIKKSEYQPPIETDSLNIPLNLGVYYFPIEFLIDTINTYLYHTVLDNGFIYRRTDQAHYLNWWYSEQLFAFKEPLLYNGYFRHEIYRFTWLRSFDEPVVIRVENKDESIRLFVKMINNNRIYKAEEILINDTIVLSTFQWTELNEKLNKIDFWNIDPIENTNGSMGTDGAQWILEGLKDGEYHMIDRWNGKNKVTGEVCLYLLQISGLEVDKIY